MVWESFLEEGASELGQEGRTGGHGHKEPGLWSARPALWPRVWLVLGPCRCLSLWPGCLPPWPTDGCELGSPSPRNVALRQCLFYLHAVGSTSPSMFLEFGSQEFPPLRLQRSSHGCL